MAKNAKNNGYKDQIKKVEQQLGRYQENIVTGITHLLYEEDTDKQKMTSLLCTGIVGLTTSVCVLRDLKREDILRGQKDELTEFVEREMERVAGQRQFTRG